MLTTATSNKSSTSAATSTKAIPEVM